MNSGEEGAAFLSALSGVGSNDVGLVRADVPVLLMTRRNDLL